MWCWGFEEVTHISKLNLHCHFSGLRIFTSPQAMCFSSQYTEDPWILDLYLMVYDLFSGKSVQFFFSLTLSGSWWGAAERMVGIFLSKISSVRAITRGWKEYGPRSWDFWIWVPDLHELSSASHHFLGVIERSFQV